MKCGRSVHSFLSYMLCWFTLAGILTATSLASAQTSSATKKSTSSKKSAYMGDPARKRGLEIGFDLGLQAGREDKAKNVKPLPQEKEAYKKPEKYFRSEFGSQGNFVSGFKNGFLNGYQQAFGKKVPLKPDGTITGATTTTLKKPKDAAPPPANPAGDAL